MGLRSSISSLAAECNVEMCVVATLSVLLLAAAAAMLLAVAR